MTRTERLARLIVFAWIADMCIGILIEYLILPLWRQHHG